ncbi:hypothetical protein Goari_002131 [Gossypium aridum]|uniref:Uncharacterized protein n=1 Tax=Gossypium aridum TaxID=34290 RepID=A0A7J8Y7I6_GOSAI|nr:hypothetical protein [Gossypium aridum]
MARICPRRKMGIDLETEDEQGNRELGVQMDLAMERHPHLMPLNHQSHPQALECLMERGDSQWDADDH